MQVNAFNQCLDKFSQFPLVLARRHAIIDECMKRFNKMVNDHPQLFENDAINDAFKEVILNDKNPLADFHNTLDIEPDCYGYTFEDPNACLTADIGPNIVIASSGKNAEGEKFVGLYNFCGKNERQTLQQIKNYYEMNKCKDIEFYLIGGYLPYIDEEDTIDEWHGDCEACINAQENFLKLKDEFNIVAVRFNITKVNDEEACVVVSRNGVFWTK